MEIRSRPTSDLAEQLVDRLARGDRTRPHFGIERHTQRRPSVSNTANSTGFFMALSCMDSCARPPVRPRRTWTEWTDVRELGQKLPGIILWAADAKQNS